MLKKEIISFGDALRGLKFLFTQERHAIIHLVITCLVIIAGLWLNISTTDWLFILVAIALVITTEALNTSVEKLCDVVHPAENKHIGFVKDIAAGAVLFAAIIAVIMGLIIFIPYIHNL